MILKASIIVSLIVIMISLWFVFDLTKHFKNFYNKIFKKERYREKINLHNTFSTLDNPYNQEQK